MKSDISFFISCFALVILSGCGGGGGGASNTSPTTSNPSVFISSSSINNAVTLGYLRQMSISGGYLYVVDSLSANGAVTGRIRKFDASSGAYIKTEIASGGSADQQNAVYSVAVNGNDIYITGTDNSAGLTGTGVINLNSSTSNLTAAALQSPYGLVVGNNKLFVTDIGGTGDKVVIYNVTVSPPTLISSITVATNPVGLAYDSSGFVYVTTQTAGTNGVYKISASSPYTVSAFANSSLFKNPNGIAVRTSPNEIYVVDTGTTDTNSSVLKISADGSTVTKLLDGADSSSMLCAPIGAAISGNVLYISNGTCTANSSYAKSVIKVTLAN